MSEDWRGREEERGEAKRAARKKILRGKGSGGSEQRGQLS